jgi:hypothetical protein
MSQEFDDFAIWQALSLGSPNKAQATFVIQNTSQIKLDYCIPQSFTKKRTDVTGVQEETDVHPDTGPAGALIELQITIDRGATTPEFLKTLIRWYGTQNTDSDFKRGFLGLENDDNPELDLVPSASLGYRLIQFGIISPVSFKAKQTYKILLQLGGPAITLPVFP